MKILQIVAREFSIDIVRVRIETTNTTRVANASPTAASTGADLNGMAAKIAADKILKRLKKVAANIYEDLRRHKTVDEYDDSTNNLINYFLENSID